MTSDEKRCEVAKRIRELPADVYNVADELSRVAGRLHEMANDATAGRNDVRIDPSGFHALAYYMESWSRSVEECRKLQDELARTKRLQKVTADHLRKARTDLHNAHEDVEHAERLLSRWSGNETSFERQRTPEHYRGDGLVTCSRAMHSAMSQEMCASAELMPAMAVYWWGLAFKYVWRMWSKNDPREDAQKAKDCIGKAVKAWEESQDED